MLSAAVAVLCTGGATTPKSRSFEERYKQGLAVWRKPGQTPDHAACATCHSPDGIELASYAFDDADILRRAEPHLGTADGQTIVDFIHAVREKLGITRLLDPMNDRPFQPSDTVLPGATPEERDLAFGHELQHRMPTLFTKIQTVEQAEQAKKELIEVNPFSLSFGIPITRLSEDVAHGTEHSSIAQWLPELAPRIPADKMAAWFAAEDDYVANPTVDELRRLVALHEKLCGLLPGMGMNAISEGQYRGLLLLQHRLRTGGFYNVNASDESPEIKGPGLPNPIWELGVVARDLIRRKPAELGFTTELNEKKLAGPELSTQLSQLRLSWFWLGWLLDQGMNLSTGDNTARLGQWLSEALWHDGPYAIHDVYTEARRQVVISNDPAAWTAAPDRRHLFWDFPGPRVDDGYEQIIPPSGEHRQLYLTFAENCFRANLLLLKEDLEKTHVVWIRLNTKMNVKVLCAFLTKYDPASSDQTAKLHTELDALIAGARERV